MRVVSRGEVDARFIRLFLATVLSRRSMKNIKPDEFRNILDQFDTTYTREGSEFYVPWKDTETESGVEIVVISDLGEEKIQAVAMKPGYSSNLSLDEKFRFCNDWNFNYEIPKAFLDKSGDFVLETCLFHDKDVSLEFVRDVFVQLSLDSSLLFFKTLKERIEK